VDRVEIYRKEPDDGIISSNRQPLDQPRETETTRVETYHGSINFDNLYEAD